MALTFLRTRHEPRAPLVHPVVARQIASEVALGLTPSEQQLEPREPVDALERIGTILTGCSRDRATRSTLASVRRRG